MKKIFKYEIKPQDTQILSIQSKNILSAEEQHGKIVIYALVDTEIESIEYEFGLNGTGNNINFDIDLFEFLDTVKMDNGLLMFHIFYRTIRKKSLKH